MLAPSVLSLPKGYPARAIDLAEPLQQLHLVKMVGKIKPALLVIDSLSGATSGVETSLPAVRALLGFLTSLAQRANLALLVVHHLRKRPPSGRLFPLRRVLADDLRGSSHISAAARSVLALSPCPEPVEGPSRPSPFPIPPTAVAASTPSPAPPPAERRRLEVVKTNLCRRPPPLGGLRTRALRHLWQDGRRSSRRGIGGEGGAAPAESVANWSWSLPLLDWPTVNPADRGTLRSLRLADRTPGEVHFGC